jgi:hypothetical protein
VTIHVLLEETLGDVLINAHVGPSWLLCTHADTARARMVEQVL